MNHFVYLFGNIGLIACIVVLIIVSLVQRDWIHQGDLDSYWSGGLLNVSQTKRPDVPCQDKECSIYWNIKTAGMILLAFDSFCILLLILLLFPLCKLITNKRVPQVLIFSLEISAMICHFFGFVIWASITNIRFEKSCVVTFNSSKDAPVCVDSGSILSLAILLLIPIQIFCMCFTVNVIKKIKKKRGNLSIHEVKASTPINKA